MYGRADLPAPCRGVHELHRPGAGFYVTIKTSRTRDFDLFEYGAPLYDGVFFVDYIADGTALAAADRLGGRPGLTRVLARWTLAAAA